MEVYLSRENDFLGDPCPREPRMFEKLLNVVPYRIFSIWEPIAADQRILGRIERLYAKQRLDRPVATFWIDMSPNPADDARSLAEYLTHQTDLR